jgi:hypothetical protein
MMHTQDANSAVQQMLTSFSLSSYSTSAKATRLPQSSGFSFQLSTFTFFALKAPFAFWDLHKNEGQGDTQLT